MTTIHKHWSVPAYADERALDRVEALAPVLPAAPAAAAVPALTHVYIGRREYEDSSVTKVFATREACVDWRDGLCGDYDNFEIYHREIKN